MTLEKATLTPYARRMQLSKPAGPFLLIAILLPIGLLVLFGLYAIITLQLHTHLCRLLGLLTLAAMLPYFLRGPQRRKISHRKLKPVGSQPGKRAGKPQPTGRPGTNRCRACSEVSLCVQSTGDVAQRARQRAHTGRSVASSTARQQKCRVGPSRHRSAGNPGAANPALRRTPRPTLPGIKPLKVFPRTLAAKKSRTSSHRETHDPWQRLRKVRMLTPEGIARRARAARPWAILLKGSVI